MRVWPGTSPGAVAEPMSNEHQPPSGDPSWRGDDRPRDGPDARWQQPSQPTQQHGWGPPQQGWQPDPYGPPAQAPGSATTALVLGILGIVLCPLVLSIPAWIVGKNARDEAEQLPGRPGWGNANAGYVLGIIGTVLGIVLVVAMVIYLIVVAAVVSEVDEFTNEDWWE